MGIIAMTLPAQADETGFIQVKCEPDVQILLNMSPRGVTTADVGGLIIQHVTPDRYELSAVKPSGNMLPVVVVTAFPPNMQDRIVLIMLPGIGATAQTKPIQ